MKMPWDGMIERRVEAVIEERGYGDLILAGLEATVSGDAGNVLKTSALEAAAGMWARALSAATVTGDRGALTRRVRHMIGRGLIRYGEQLFVIEVEGSACPVGPGGILRRAARVAVQGRGPATDCREHVAHLPPRGRPTCDLER